MLAYSPCIAHGYDLSQGLNQQKLAVDTGYWPLLRFDPRRAAEGESALSLDSPPPKKRLGQFTYNEARFGILARSDPERARDLLEQAQAQVDRRYQTYASLRGDDAPKGQKE